MASNLPQSGVSLVAKNAGQFIASMRGAEGALGSFQRGAGAMSQIVTGALRRVGEMVVNMAATAVKAVGGWLKDSVGVAGDFEQTLNVLGATSGATAADLDRVADKAKELGADLTLPATSAQDAAEVMLELSKAGLSVQESMDAAKGALQLSAAAQVDAATAAGIMAGALNAFELPASDAVRIADLLAAGANASSASMTDLAQGTQQAGFAFHAAGLPVEDLVTSLAALTNVGLTGSDSGTALKNALMRLMNPTQKAAGLMQNLGFSAYDANGKMKPLPRLIHDLNASLSGMTDEQRNAALGTIFLSDGMKAMIPLLSLGEEGFLKLKDQVTVAGSAADVAGAQMKGWNGAIAGAKSQMETLQLIIGTLIKNALTPLAFRAGEILSKIVEMADRFSKLIPQIQASASPFKTLLSVIALLNPSLIGVVGLILRLATVLNPLIGALGDAGPFSLEFAEALNTLLGPLGITQSSLVTATTALQQIWAAGQQVATTLQAELPGALASAQGALAAVANFILGTVLPAVAQAATWFAANLPAGIATAKAAFADIGGFISTIMPTIVSIVTTALAIVSTFWQQHGATILAIARGAWEAIKGLIQVVLGIIQGTLAITLGLMTGDWESAHAQMDQAGQTFWNGILQFLKGILNAIASLFGTSLDGLVSLWAGNFAKMKALIETAAAGWKAKFDEIRATVESVMAQAAAIVQSKIDAIKGAFSGIVGAINGVISAIGRFVSSLGDIHLPSWLTPGSPTPFEIGLRGIDKAAAQAARTLQAQFVPAIALQASPAAALRPSAPLAMPVPFQASSGRTPLVINVDARGSTLGEAQIRRAVMAGIAEYDRSTGRAVDARLRTGFN